MKKRRPILPLLLLAGCAVVAAAAVVAPLPLMQPQTLHTPDLIERAYRVGSWSRWIAFAMLLIGGWLFTIAWRRGGSIARGLAAVPLLLLVATTFFSGQYLLEWLAFEPIETIRFVGLEEASHVADEELVMGLVVEGQARAYPVRMMAYHHIANDRLAGEPYVVTY